MESLLAAYASDDDESPAADAPPSAPAATAPSNPRGLFGSLPAPKNRRGDGETRVEFRPPVDVSDLAENHESKKKKPRRSSDANPGSATILGGLVLPAPRHTSGAVLGGGAGSGARCSTTHTPADVENAGHYEQPAEAGYYEQPADAGYADTGYYEQPAVDADYPSGAGYYGEQEQMMPAGASFVAEPEEEDPVAKADRRRDRGEAVKFVSIKQDELTANRPRQDQMRLTGIAFGSMFKETEEGSGSKPSKLHKRKHQIGSLLYDLKQKEMELAERRAQGFLSKAQTHAKYGW